MSTRDRCPTAAATVLLSQYYHRYCYYPHNNNNSQSSASSASSSVATSLRALPPARAYGLSRRNFGKTMACSRFSDAILTFLNAIDVADHDRRTTTLSRRIAGGDGDVYGDGDPTTSAPRNVSNVSPSRGPTVLLLASPFDDADDNERSMSRLRGRRRPTHHRVLVDRHPRRDDLLVSRRRPPPPPPSVRNHAAVDPEKRPRQTEEEIIVRGASTGALRSSRSGGRASARGGWCHRVDRGELDPYFLGANAAADDGDPWSLRGREVVAPCLSRDRLERARLCVVAAGGGIRAVAAPTTSRGHRRFLELLRERAPSCRDDPTHEPCAVDHLADCARTACAAVAENRDVDRDADLIAPDVNELTIGSVAHVTAEILVLASLRDARERTTRDADDDPGPPDPKRWNPVTVVSLLRRRNRFHEITKRLKQSEVEIALEDGGTMWLR